MRGDKAEFVCDLRWVGDSARDGDARSWSQGTSAHFRELAVAIESEEVVPSSDPHAPAGGELHLEDPVGRTLVPTSDLVVSDFERVRIERDD